MHVFEIQTSNTHVSLGCVRLNFHLLLIDCIRADWNTEYTHKSTQKKMANKRRPFIKCYAACTRVRRRHCRYRRSVFSMSSFLSSRGHYFLFVFIVYIVYRFSRIAFRMTRSQTCKHGKCWSQPKNVWFLPTKKCTDLAETWVSVDGFSAAFLLRIKKARKLLIQHTLGHTKQRKTSMECRTQEDLIWDDWLGNIVCYCFGAICQQLLSPYHVTLTAFQPWFCGSSSCAWKMETKKTIATANSSSSQNRYDNGRRGCFFCPFQRLSFEHIFVLRLVYRLLCKPI